MQLFNQATDELERFLLDSITPKLAEAFVANPSGRVSEDALFGLFAEYVVSNYSQELQTYRCGSLCARVLDHLVSKLGIKSSNSAHHPALQFMPFW